MTTRYAGFKKHRDAMHNKLKWLLSLLSSAASLLTIAWLEMSAST